MASLAVEIVNADEDIAEKATQVALDALSLTKTCNIKTKTLVTEPHDDYRGIWAKVDIALPKDATSHLRSSICASLKSLIVLQLHENRKVGINVSIRTDEGVTT